MGCAACTHKTSDLYSIEDIFSNNAALPTSTKYNLTDYIKTVFCLINKIRTNPSGFSSIVEDSKKFIKNLNGKLIFDHKLKVSLYKGTDTFEECSQFLKNLKPMEELKFKDDIVLECPNEPDKIKDKNFFKEKVLEKKTKYNLGAFFKDAICEPEISVLLMIVDDAEKNPRRKRMAVLNPDYKYIGISNSVLNNDNDNNNVDGKVPFCAYFSFSK